MIVETEAGTIDLGTTETTPTIAIVDYSRRVTDDFGVTTVVERGFSRRLSVRLAVPFEDVDGLQRQLAALRATSAMWVADDRFDWLSAEGFYKDFEVDLAVPPISYCTLTVEGLAETETVADAGEDPAPEGSASTFAMLKPVVLDTAALAATNVSETDYPQWQVGTSYTVGARVILAGTHRIYESLIAGNLGWDPTSAADKWLDVGPTNRWAMFDQALGTATTRPNNVQVTLNVTAVDAIAVLDAVGLNVRVQATGYDQTKPAGEGAVSFLDLPSTSGQVTVTVSGVGTISVGTLLVGRLLDLGMTEASPTAGITDYSRKDVDGFGEVTIVERAWAKRMTAKSLIATEALDIVANRIAAVRATPVLWIGDGELDSLTVYGFFKDFSIEVGETVSKLSLSIEGLSEAAALGPPGVSWSDVRDDDPDHPRPQDGATVGAPEGTPVGDRNAEDVTSGIDLNTTHIAAAQADIDDAQADIADLFTTYGDTASAAASADEADQARILAEAARDVANTAKVNAEAAEDDAVAARNAAQGARDTAITKASEASGSATVAAGHASTATTKASEAAGSATAAAGSATTATTKAGEASTSASNAATSATNAAGSASSAATQAGVAAAAYSAAKAAALVTGPERTDAGGSYFVGFGGAAFVAADAVAFEGNYAITMVAGNTNSAVLSGTRYPAIAGRIYEVEVEYYLATKPGGNVLVRNQCRSVASDGSHVAADNDAGYTFTAAGQRTTLTSKWSNVAGTGIRAWPAGATELRFGGNPYNGGGTVYVTRVRVRDVTAREAAANSAAAASTSASNAAASNTAAGNSASAAQTSATNASTSAGQANTSAGQAATSASNASTSAGQASTSASNAAGSASTASTQATNAANSATSAGNSASAAAGSASTASTKASEASTSASSANTSATNASTSAGQASTSAGQASSSATAASGSASSASSSAGTAATHATNAGNSASAAAGSASSSTSSASTATTQASIATTNAAAAQSSAVLAANIGTGALNGNAGFDDYPSATVGAFPTGWGGYTQSAENGYRAADPIGGYAYRLPGTAGQTVFAAWRDVGGAYVRQNGYYVIEADVVLRSGALTGAGVLFRTYNGDTTTLDELSMPFTTTPDQTGAAPGAGTAGKVYQFRKLVKVLNANAKGIGLLAMSHYTGFGSVAAANEIEWRKCLVRPATPAEIRDQTVVPTLEASVAVNAGAISTIEAQAAYYEVIVAAAGGNPAMVQLLAGDGGSAVGLVADRIALGNDVDGIVEDVLIVEDGKAKINDAIIRRLRVAPTETSEIVHEVQLKPISVLAGHGTTVQYQGGATYGQAPDRIEVDIAAAALPALAAGEAYDIRAINITATQFEVKAIKTTAGGATTQTSAAGSNVGGTPQWQTNKPFAANAKDGNYQFGFTVTLNRTAGPNFLVTDEAHPENGKWNSTYSGQVTLYGKIGSTWTSLGTFTISRSYSTSYAAGSSSHTATKSFGASQIVNSSADFGNGSNRFGIHPGTGATITAFAGVTYSSQTTGTETALGGLFKFAIYPPTGN